MNTPYFENTYPFLSAFEGEEINSFNGETYEGDDYSDLFGIGKNAKEKKKLRLERKGLRNDTIRAKAEGIRSGTYQPGSGFANVLNGVVGAAKNIIGGGKEQAPAEVSTNGSENVNTPTPAGKKNTLIWVGLGLLIVVAVYFFVIKPKIKK